MNKPAALLVIAATLLYGCDSLYTPEERMHLEIMCWEYQVELPPETSPAQLSELEKNLKKEGYQQVVFRNRHSDSWTPVLIGRMVYATRKPPVKPLPPTTPSQCR